MIAAPSDASNASEGDTELGLQTDSLRGDQVRDAAGRREVQVFDRIVSSPAILGGKPCVRGTRISVEFLMELVASGARRDDILHAYPHLTTEDVAQALTYAARSARNEVVIAAEVHREAA